MKERWQKLSSRFNALAPRERVLVFVATLFVTIAIFYVGAIEPLLLQKKRLAAQLAEARQNIKTTDDLMRIQESAADPHAVKRSYRDALRKQLSEIDQNMQGLQKGLVPPEHMARLLEEMLVRGHGLQLMSLRTLPAQRFENPGAAPAPKAGDKGAKPAAKEPERSVYQHSYEIVLQGSYADFHDYLAGLERLPWRMFWGRMTLDSEQYPRLRVTLTVHTLSLSKAWLIV